MENGLPIVFATGVHTGCTRYFAKPDSGINGVEDLRGKKVGVLNLTDSSVINLKRKLGDYGIKVALENSEVEFIQYEISALALALENDQVDSVRELKELGVLKPDTDVDAFIKRGYVDIEGIPEGYIYDAEKKEFLEIGKEI